MDLDLVRRVSEYRTLKGKRDQLHRLLTAREIARLVELERLLAHRRFPLSVSVTFRGAGRVLSGRTRDLSSDGLSLATETSLPVGTSTIVAILDPETSEEWRFGAEVVRLDADGGGMALRLVGLPLALRVGYRGDVAMLRD